MDRAVLRHHRRIDRGRIEGIIHTASLVASPDGGNQASYDLTRHVGILAQDPEPTCVTLTCSKLTRSCKFVINRTGVPHGRCYDERRGISGTRSPVSGEL